MSQDYNPYRCHFTPISNNLESYTSASIRNDKKKVSLSKLRSNFIIVHANILGVTTARPGHFELQKYPPKRKLYEKK